MKLSSLKSLAWRVFSIAALALSLPAGIAQAALTWQITASPFMLTFVNDSGAVTSEIDAATIGAGGRLSYKSGGTIANNTGTSFHLTNLISQVAIPNGVTYSVATNETGRTANVTVAETAHGVRVSIAFVGAGTGAVTTVWEALSAGANEHYLSGSSAAHLDLRGWIRAWRPGKEGNHVEEYCKNQAEVATPYYFSSGGYGYYAETANVGRFSFPGANPNAADGPNCAGTPSVPSGATTPLACPFNAAIESDRVQVCLRGAQMTYDIYDGSPQTVTSDYYATVGLPLMPPPAQYGLWKWRDVTANQAQLLSDVSSFVNNNIPITGVWIDNPWEVQPASNTTRQNGSACTNSGAFDSRFFPDPQGMINTVHSQGVLFGLWVGPNVVGPGGSSTTGGGTCITNPQWNANHWFIPGTNYIDFTNQSAWQAWVNLYTPLFSMGVDMAKEDRAEEFQLETATLAAGSGATLYTQYPAFYHDAVTQALRNARVARGLDSEGFVTFVRTAFTGDAQVTHGMWASDMFHDFTALQAAVRLGVGQSLTGAPASWGSDTGGIDPRSPATNTNSPTKTAFLRWAQFSAMSSGLEVGGAGLNQDPVGNYDATTLGRFRSAVVLHYELFPYFYALAQTAATQGLPVMRGVGFHYPADLNAWAQDQEFMVGANLLVAPVTGSTAEADGAAGNPTNVPVYLPVGNWVDVFNGSLRVGPTSFVRSSSLDEFPLYMLSGSALGFNLRTPNVFSTAWGVNNLTEQNRAGWMYAPQQGQAQATSFYGVSGAVPSQAALTASTNGNAIQLNIANAPAEAQALVLMQTAPSSVVIDQSGVPQAPSLAALQAMPQGWIFTSAPFGGVLLKLAPTGGVSQVNITTAAPVGVTTTIVSGAPNPSVYGQSVTFTATVNGGTNPTGSVQYQVDGANSGVPIALANGQALLTLANLTAGSHAIAAVYGGDGNNLGSTSAAWTQTVNVAATSTTLASTGVATVAPLAPGGGVPTGAVQFKNGATNVGAPVALVGGLAALPPGALQPGQYTLTAAYGGDANFAPSSGTAAVTVLGPVVNAGPDASVVKGTPFSSAGSFTQIGASSSWTASVDYGDGGGPQPLSLSGMTFALSHVYANVGVYNVVVTVIDDTGHPGSDTAVVTVTYVPSGVRGDVDGDGVVTCQDLTIASSIVGKHAGQPGFFPTADIDANGVIDIRDISAIARLLPAGTHC